MFESVGTWDGARLKTQEGDDINTCKEMLIKSHVGLIIRLKPTCVT